MGALVRWHGGDKNDSILEKEGETMKRNVMNKNAGMNGIVGERVRIRIDEKGGKTKWVGGIVRKFDWTKDAHWYVIDGRD